MNKSINETIIFINNQNIKIRGRPIIAPISRIFMVIGYFQNVFAD